MTSPRSTYGGGGYYSAPSFADTPIYDSLVAERGKPQIAPIRVPAAPYETADHLPSLPSALPALPSGAGYQTQQPAPARGYPPPGHQPAPAQQPAPLQQTPAPYIPQQAGAPRGGYGHQHPNQPQMRPVAAPRPVPPRQMPAPAPAPAPYPSHEEPYGHPYQGRGY
ncbi:hypothetical protein F0L17_23365 [Streptomyces sp. TRM43335]|uniref:Uncharacterized protein n=1 Tax=Streptomyces taklimakanensis TaxID=2569853 RepID=A0A6G2BIA4_9ACTN|nr:DUF6643 family protein [Streptomyces taklimakanensis]MTE21998.1 hypothetical protein [Streptomyces taklimakanensis]